VALGYLIVCALKCKKNKQITCLGYKLGSKLVFRCYILDLDLVKKKIRMLECLNCFLMVEMD